MPLGSSVPVLVIKNIDYTTLYAFDVDFIDQSKYLETVLINQGNSTNSSGYQSSNFLSNFSSNFSSNIFLLL